ncbi:MAG TPA: tetratricopeptide repeat protein [Usitatibacteraceae bacterium]|nr:tetratricopeptide repeat protein [Usitatibacteraceae bacterium]
MTELQDNIARAIALRQDGQHTEALAILLDLVGSNPNDAKVNYELAATYDRQGVEDEAIGFYEHALTCGLQGEDLRCALLGLGSSYRCAERYGDALRVLHKGAAAFPDAAEFDVFLALTQYNLGDPAEAMRLLLNHIAEHTGDEATARFRRAIAWYAEHLDPPYEK